MLFPQISILFVFVVLTSATSADEEIYEQVRAYLSRARALRALGGRGESTEWLPNCGKTALGFDPMRGEPVCFTGECRANGFNQPIFEMNYVKKPTGTCVTKFIPENVNLNCLPTTDQKSRTEEISDFQQLSESMANGASWQIGIGSLARRRRVAPAIAGAFLGVIGTMGSVLTRSGPLGAIAGAVKPSGGLVSGVLNSGLAGRAATMGIMSSFGLSFGGSSQTRSTVNNLVKYESKIYFSTATMTTAELSLYAPKAKLSAEFRHAIEHLPCCTMTPVREKYIYDNILNNFGSAFLTSLVLGGTAQNTITVKTVDINGMTNNGADASKFANVAFGEVFKFGSQSMTSEEEASYNQFKSLIATSRFTTQGGAIYNRDQTLNEWFATIPDNPVVVSFDILPIFDLLTQEENRFPNDSQIFDKSVMIATVLEKIYNNTNVYCENDCMGRGECIYTGYFMYGLCNCEYPWDGIDCSVYNLNATTRYPQRTTTTTKRSSTNRPSFLG